MPYPPEVVPKFKGLYMLEKFTDSVKYILKMELLWVDGPEH